MGNNISVIGNHCLDTSTLENLADDIFKRLDVNLALFCHAKEHHLQLLKNVSNETILPARHLVKDASCKTYRLYDDYYIRKKLLKQYGESVFYNPAYWINEHFIPGEDKIREEIQHVRTAQYELQLVDSQVIHWIDISKEHFTNHFPTKWSWHSLVSFLKEKDLLLHASFHELQHFRQELKHYSKAFGGNCFFYLNSEDELFKGLGQGEEWNLAWDSLCEEIKCCCSHGLLDLPEYLSNPAVRELILSGSHFPNCLVDNYRDLV